MYVGISRAPKQEPVVPQIPVPLTMRTAQVPAEMGQFSVASYVQDLYCEPHGKAGQGNGSNSIDGSKQGCLKRLRPAKAVCMVYEPFQFIVWDWGRTRRGSGSCLALEISL